MSIVASVRPVAYALKAPNIQLPCKTFVLGVTKVSRQDNPSKNFLVVDLERVSLRAPGNDVELFIPLAIFEQAIE